MFLVIILLLCSLFPVLALDDIDLGVWQLWSNSDWDEAHRRATTDTQGQPYDPDFFVTEWDRLKDINSTKFVNHISHQNAHINAYDSTNNKIISNYYPEVNQFGENEWTGYNSADDLKWPFNMIMRKYADYVETDSFAFRDSLKLRIVETVEAMQNAYPPGTPGFGGYDFTDEAWERPNGNLVSEAQAERAFDIMDIGISKIRERDITSPIYISMNFRDPIGYVNNGNQDPSPTQTLLAPKPFKANDEGAGWNVHVNFYYNLYGDLYFDEKYGNKNFSYEGYYYQELFDRSLRAMLHGSRWIHDYRRNFYSNGHTGPAPYWVHCIQVHRTNRRFMESPGSAGDRLFTYREYRRRPTAEEIYAYAYLGLIAGAEGVYCWPYSGNETDYAIGSTIYYDDDDTDWNDGYWGSYHKMIDRGVIDWDQRNSLNSFRNPLVNEPAGDNDVSTHARDQRYTSSPYDETSYLYQDLQNQLPVIKSLDWAWAVTGSSNYGTDITYWMDYNTTSPRPNEFPGHLSDHFLLRDVSGDQSYSIGGAKDLSNAKIGLFKTPNDHNSDYYLVLNARCNKVVGTSIQEGDTDYFRFTFETESSKYYRLYDVFSGSELWASQGTGGNINTSNISFAAGKARLLHLSVESSTNVIPTSITSSVYIGNSNGSPSHYRLTGDVTISGSNAKLHIYPGTFIEVTGNYGITVSNSGSLLMNPNGSNSSRITFQPSQRLIHAATDKRRVWKGITYNSSASDPSYIYHKYVTIKNAYYGIKSYVNYHNFNYCEFEECYFSLYTYINSTTDGTIRLYNSDFKDCRYGPYIKGHGCYFSNCDVENSVIDGIRLYNVDQAATLTGCNVLKTGRNGIKIYDHTGSDLVNILNSKVLYSCTDPTSSYGGILLDNAPNIKLTNVSIDLNIKRGLYVGNNSSVELNGCQIAENGKTQTGTWSQAEVVSLSTGAVTPGSNPNSIYDDCEPTTVLFDNYGSMNIGQFYFGETMLTSARISGPGTFSSFFYGSKPTGHFLAFDPDDPNDQLALAKTLVDSQDYSEALEVLDDIMTRFQNEGITGAALGLWCNVRKTLGDSPQQIIDYLDDVPEEITDYNLLRGRQLLKATYMMAEDRFDDAIAQYQYIAERSNSVVDSLEAMIAIEEIRIHKEIFEEFNPTGRTTASFNHFFEVKQSQIKEYEDTIDELYELMQEALSVDESAMIPIDSKLGTAYPNPFNPSVTIPFALKKTQDVKIAIYNVLGQRVIELIDESRIAGHHSVVWNGVSDNGLHVSSGIYFILMQTTDGIDTRKIVMLK